MSTLVVDTLTNQEPQLAKAWVNYNGAGTVAIRAAYNVSSITDGGTGIFTVNFTTAMSDANYSVICTGENYDSSSNTLSFGVRTTTLSGGASLKSPSQVTVFHQSSSGSNIDGSEQSVVIFR